MTTFLCLPASLQVLIGSIAFLFAAVIVAVGIAIFCAAAYTLAYCVSSIIGYIRGETKRGDKNETQNLSD